MQIGYNWLMDYLSAPVPLEQLSELLTNIGLEVEGIEQIEQIPGSLAGLVVGEVLTCVPHHNADKLKVTEVAIGLAAPLQIVCGAANVAAGQKVIVAKVGSTLHPSNGAPFEIKNAKIRGVASSGMICAEDEIGLGSSHEGIMVLPPEVKAGTPAAAYFELPAPQAVLSIGLTPNRSDAMSHLGTARDAVAYLRTMEPQNDWQLISPELKPLPPVANPLPISVQVQDAALCPRYAGIVLRNISVGPSPAWMQERLISIGLRPINNVVDITNYVLHEYGQPLHAFDYDKIKNHEIVVKKAAAESNFTTLEGKTRKMNGSELMICDAAQAMCMAGVMGGIDSGVTQSTSSIFLESAFFDPKNIRRSSMAHGLRTDAAIHFEKTVDITAVTEALTRAVQLLQEHAMAEPASELIDLYPNPAQKASIACSYQYIKSICGRNFHNHEIDDILTALGFEFTEKNDTDFVVSVPLGKADISLPADLAEEVLRISGLNAVAISQRLSYSLTDHEGSAPARRIKNRMAQWLSDRGLSEIVTNSITNDAYYPDQQGLVKMLNSLSAGLNVLRPSLLESGLEVLAYNINRKQSDLALYEIGHTYRQHGAGQYQQEEHLAIYTTGAVAGKNWQRSAVGMDIYYLKGLVEALAKMLGIGKLKYTLKEDLITLKSGKATLATLTQVPMDKLKAFGIKQVVYYADLLLPQWIAATQQRQIQYQELPKHPGVQRDLALVLPKDVKYSDIERTTNTANIEAMTSFSLFDIFEGEKLGADKRSWALNYQFQAADKTLTDPEVDAMMQILIAKYQKELCAEIRV